MVVARPKRRRREPLNLRTHGRLGYSAITARPALGWPGGARLAFYIGFNLEHFAFGEGLGAGIAPASAQPEVLNHSWREYGNRFGVWRCLELFDALARRSVPSSTPRCTTTPRTSCRPSRRAATSSSTTATPTPSARAA